MTLDDGYLLPVKAPVLTGTALRLYLSLAESSLFGPVRASLLRANGFAALGETFLAEEPNFRPDTSIASWDGEEVSGVLEVLSPGSAAPAAAATAAAAFAAGPSSHQQETPPRRRTAADYHTAYLAGATTPEKVAEAVIAAVAASEACAPPLRLFIAHDPARLRSAARASGERYRRGAPVSPLDGVPFAVKDILDIAGYPTTAGTAFLAEARPATGTGPAAAALLDCGALLVGKTNLHEIGLGTTGLNTAHGTPRNPHSTAHHTGGSSSGSAAAVAAGICPLAIATDGGGSIRIPGALCGIWGLKPTHGRVCSRHHPAIDQTVSVLGPVAGSLADCVLAYAAMANQGHGPREQPPPLALPRALGGGSKPLEGLVAGVYWKWFEDAEGGVVATCRAALTALEGAGMQVKAITLPELQSLALAHSCTISSEMGNNMAAVLADGGTRGRLNRETRASLSIAAGFGATDYIQAQKVRTRAAAHFRAAFRRCSVIATPTCPTVAPRIRAAALQGGETDVRTTTSLMRFMVQANMLGLPALTVPVGMAAGDDSARGGLDPGPPLPVGLQIIGQPWHEGTLLRIGAALDAAQGEVLPLLAMHFDVLADALAA